jgi:NADPH:quinone reductase
VRAWRVHDNGEPQDVLRMEQAPEPEPGPGQVRVKVRAAALNFPDVLLCRGHYQVRPPLPFTPGVELCGVVEQAGEGVEAQIGRRVMGTADLPAGGFGELALMKADGAFPAPQGLDDAAASGFHIAYQTAWFALHRRAALRAGETLLVHAAAGGVGSAAVQLGLAAGARVVAVVGGEEKAAAARALGAETVVDRTSEDVIARVKEVTGGRGADVVYDPVGGDAFTWSTKCVGFEGRIVIVGFASGDIPRAALNHALVKNYTIQGLHWGLYNDRDPDAVVKAHAELTRLADEGVARPLIDSAHPVEELVDGLNRLAKGRVVGRAVVTWP